MKKLLHITLFLLCLQLTAQENMILSQRGAVEKGISPMWPGCYDTRFSIEKCFDRKLREHLIQNFKYPEAAVSEQLEGTVVVEFLINKFGKVEVLDIIGGHKHLQDEALRIIMAIPGMGAARWGEKPVSVAYKVPIKFEAPR